MIRVDRNTLFFLGDARLWSARNSGGCDRADIQW